MLRALKRSTAGNAATEFALFASLFMIVFMAVMDIAYYFIQQRQLAQAVSSASVAAFASRDSVNFSAIPGYVQTASGLGQATVSLACNGQAGSCTNSSRTCACLGSTGIYTAAASCGASCSGSSGATSGYYLTVTASMPYHALVVPRKYLDGTTITRGVTIRLQ